MSSINFNCDVCGREVLGCTFVNGMKFCAKCYQETFGETEKDRKITDLQSQLAITEKALELAVEYLSCDVCPYGDGMNYCYKAAEDDEPPEDEECKNYIASYFKQKAKFIMETRNKDI